MQTNASSTSADAFAKTREWIRNVQVAHVLDRLGIKYRRNYRTLELFQDWKPTDGWRADENTGAISDFSGKWRAAGDRVNFVASYLGITKGEAIEWYASCFGTPLPDDYDKIKSRQKTSGSGLLKEIRSTQHVPKPIIPDQARESQPQAKETHEKVMSAWDSLPEVSEHMCEYLMSRCVDCSLLEWIAKDYNGFIGVLVKGFDGKAHSINARKPSKTDKDFRMMPNTVGTGIMGDGYDKSSEIYLTEGLMDYLTIRQYTSQAISMKSCKQGLEDVKALAEQGYRFVLIPDADEQGEEMARQLEAYDFPIFDLRSRGYKDINELAVKEQVGAELLDIIQDGKERRNGDAKKALDKLMGISDLYVERGRLGYPSPFEIIDQDVEGIIEWKVYTIGAFSNVGKSNFSYEYVQHAMRQGKRVMYFSTEVDRGLLLCHIAKFYYRTSQDSIMRNPSQIRASDFRNVLMYDNVRTLAEIDRLVRMERPDVVFIDFAQNVQCHGSSEVEKMTNYAVGIQQLAIDTNATVFSLSQVNNASRFVEGGEAVLKGSGALFASSDLIFMLSRQDWVVKLDVTKNKYGRAGQKYIVNISHSNCKAYVTRDPSQPAE